MASPPYQGRTSTDDDRDAEAPRERSLGEHIFIWIAWALAAAFWGASMTTFAGILRAARQSAPALQPVSGAPGGMGFLALSVAAFALMALALAYGSLRTLGLARRLDAAALSDTVERQGGEDMTGRSPDLDRSEREFR